MPPFPFIDKSFYTRKAAEEGLRCIMSDKISVDHLASKEYCVPLRRNTFMYVINRVYLSHKHGYGMAGVLAMYWCDTWRIFERIIHKTNPGDLFQAMVVSLRYRKRILNGDFEGLY